jgi:hypothetical protein
MSKHRLNWFLNTFDSKSTINDKFLQGYFELMVSTISA